MSYHFTKCENDYKKYKKNLKKKLYMSFMRVNTVEKMENKNVQEWF